MTLSICIITARKEPQLDWLADSLRPQLVRGEVPQLIVIDYWSQEVPQDGWTSADVAQRREQLLREAGLGFDLWIAPPKPSVWQGPHRLTKENWWAASTARNTALCLAREPFVAFCDDRLVLSPTWLKAVRHAMLRPYVVAGAYEKRERMEVRNGQVVDCGVITGKDNRLAHIRENQTTNCAGNWLYSGTFALPLAWALSVNGFEELMDSLAFEDVIFGMMLEKCGYPIKYDPRMLIIEDRTPGLLGQRFRREDKGAIGTDADKSHESLRRFATQKRTQHAADLGAIRQTLAAGGQFPHHGGQPERDWFDEMPIKQFDNL